MNDQRSFSILSRFLNGQTLTDVAREENISIVRVSQIVKRQVEHLMPQEERVKYCTPLSLKIYFREELLEQLNAQKNNRPIDS